MLDDVSNMLQTRYGITALSLEEVPSGWSASAWKVRSPSGDYFLKVYDKNKPSTKVWVARIDIYMPVVLWLYENTSLRSRMTAPLLDNDGSYKIETGDLLYMVFPFITGKTICEDRLTSGQVDEIAQITSELHSYGADVPVPTSALMETFDVSFCSNLAGRLERTRELAELAEAIEPHMATLSRAIDELEEAADVLRNSEMNYVLCHTDIHGWNLMQSDYPKKLVLIDWEGLKLAPAEADLFSFTETFFFGYAWESFMSAYRQRRREYEVNPGAMRFYRLRRRLEDIDAFIESILDDDLTLDVKNLSLHHVKRECEMLGVML